MKQLKMSLEYILSHPCQAVHSLPGGMVPGSHSHSATDKIETGTSELTWSRSVNKLVIAIQSTHNPRQERQHKTEWSLSYPEVFKGEKPKPTGTW